MSNSQTYWKKREREHQFQRIKDEKIILKQIEKRYMEAYDSIQDEINKFYANYADKENISIGEARKRADQLDIDKYAKKAKKYVKAKDFSPTANTEMRIYNLTMRVNRLELLKANIGLELVDLFNDFDKYYRTTLSEAGVNEIERQSGILGESAPKKLYEQINKIVNASYYNATFSQNLWSDMNVLKNDIGKALIRGLTQGKNPRVLARDIKHLVLKSGIRPGLSAQFISERLMISELSRVQTDVQKASYEQYGYDEYEFIAEPSACSVCEPLDGKIFKTKDMAVGENASPMHNFCKCSTAAHFDREVWDKDLKARGL